MSDELEPKKHKTTVGITNLALAKQIRATMQSNTDLISSCYTYKNGEIDIFLRDNQMQQVFFPKDKFKQEKTSGIKKSTFDVLTELIYELIKDCDTPLGTCTLEVRYLAKNQGTQFDKFRMRIRVANHYKR